MQIEHNIIDFVPEPHLIELFRRFVTAAAERVAVNADTVHRVIICSEAQYGPTIMSIRLGANHTNNDTAVGVGKTLPKCVDGAVVSDIVLCVNIFGAFAHVPEGALSPAVWPAKVQQIFYVICHEFGHARDYAVRSDLSDYPDPRSDPFLIAETARFYGDIVLTEFAACCHVSPMMTQKLFELQIQDAVERMLAIQKHANDCLKGLGDYTRRALAHIVCQAAWVFLTELARLYGDASDWDYLVEEVSTLEQKLLGATPLTDLLGAYGAAYPNWNTQGQIEKLTDVWHRYGRELFDVEFAQRPDGLDDIV